MNNLAYMQNPVSYSTDDTTNFELVESQDDKISRLENALIQSVEKKCQMAIKN